MSKSGDAKITLYRISIPALFLLSALPILTFLAVSVPPGEVPDEVAHILRADSVRHGEIAGYRRPRLDEQGAPAVDVAVDADTGLLSAGFAFSPGIPLDSKHETRAHLETMRGIPWAHRLEPVSIPNTAVYPPLFYLPAATGIRMASLSGRGPYDAILAARLMNVLAYSALGALALFFSSRGRVVLFAVLCLPMSLSLAASVNHDGIIIACAGLAGSLLCPASDASQTRIRWILGSICLTLAAMPKPFLLPMALIVLTTVPGGFRRNLRLAAAGLAVAAGPAVLWAGAMALFVAVPFVRGPARAAGPLWSGPAGTLFSTTDPGEQLHILLSSPSRLVTLPLRSAWEKGIWLWREMLGVLGTLDVTLPEFLYHAWTWALLTALLAGLIAGGERVRIDKKHGWLWIAAATGGLASLWTAYLLQYLSWTRVGDVLVDGVQGRYFLPIAALALPIAASPRLHSPAGTLISRALAMPALILALSSAPVIACIVLSAYYLR